MAELPLLGKLSYEHDERTLMFDRYVSFAQVIPNLPGSIAVPQLAAWGMMLNDSLGDCAIASPGHMTMAWTSDAGKLFVPSDTQVLQGYETQGYVPGNPSTDQGCVILNVLKQWQKGKAGLFGQHCGPYAGINTQDVTAMKTGAWSYDPATDTGPNWQVASWGGHSVPIVGYDAGGAWVITWGAPLYVTWPFI